MRIAQAIKRGKAAYEADGVFVAFASPAAVADVFESCVIPHDIASDSMGKKVVPYLIPRALLSAARRQRRGSDPVEDAD